MFYSIEHIISFVINLGLKGIARLHPYCNKQAEPITPTILLQIFDILDMTKSDLECCLFVLNLFAFYLFACESN